MLAAEQWKAFQEKAALLKQDTLAQQQELAAADAKKKCVEMSWQREEVWTKVRFQVPPNQGAAGEPKVQTVAAWTERGAGSGPDLPRAERVDSSTGPEEESAPPSCSTFSRGVRNA